MNRHFIILSIVLTLLCSCSGEKQRRDNFDITGVWKLVSSITPEGEHCIFGGSRVHCKMYDSDGRFFNYSLQKSGEKVFLLPHDMGSYTLDEDTLYTEKGNEMPLHIVNDSIITTIWKGTTETWRRAEDMTEGRKEEFRSICLEVLAGGESRVLHEFVNTANERELKHTIDKYQSTVIALGLVVLFIIIYSIDVTRRKRRAEQNLLAIKEELELRPALVNAAIKQVESNFFESDYYQMIRPRIAAGENMSDDDWREMERQINSVYTGFSRKLRSLYNFSDVEFQVCLLIKLGVSNNGIAAVINRAPNSVSSIRGRLYKKVLGEDGGAKGWDDFVLSL